MPATAKHPVDFESNAADLECAILGEAGWHSRAIARETGLSEGQVNYRLHMAGVKRSTYRDGQSVMARYTLTQFRARNNTERIAEAKKLALQVDHLQQTYIEHRQELRHPKKKIKSGHRAGGG